MTARDLAVAGAFYRDLLGLRRIASTPIADVYELGDARLYVIRMDHVEPSGETALALIVDDLAATVTQMHDAGFDLIDYVGLDQDADRVWTSPSGTRVVWVKDPDGHTLAVMQSSL